MNTLQLSLKGVEEKRPDRWVVTSNDFGFFAYGATLEEAQEAMVEGVTALINSFEGDDDQLQRFLDKKGVQYRIYDSTEQRPTMFARQLEVFVGATA